MWVLIMVFVFAALWFFPLAVIVSYNGSWRLRWLPRVWCGYAAAVPLPFGKKARRWRYPLRRLPLGFYLSLLGQLAARLSLFRFCFIVLPDRSRFRCIAGVTVGKIGRAHV